MPGLRDLSRQRATNFTRCGINSCRGGIRIWPPSLCLRVGLQSDAQKFGAVLQANSKSPLLYNVALTRACLSRREVRELKIQVRSVSCQFSKQSMVYLQYLQDNLSIRCRYPKYEGFCCADNIGSSHTL